MLHRQDSINVEQKKNPETKQDDWHIKVSE